MQRDFWVKNRVLGKWMCKGTFGLKMGLGEMDMQRDFWVKNGVLGGNWCSKGLFG